MLGQLLGGVAANVVGGIIGNEASKGDRERALSTLQDIYNQYANLDVPTVESQQISPEAYILAGEMAPEAETPELMAMRDALENVSLDPRLRKTKMDSLAMLEKIASSGGMTDEDKASLQLALNKIEADANARNQALLQQQEARGVGSSDMATATRMQNAQSAANRASEAALANQIEARKRALDAMSGAASLASQIESADYTRGSNLAQNINAREAANIAAKNAAQQRNVAARNAAEQFNLQNKQGVSNQNVTTRNQAEQYNQQLKQQQYQNQLQRLAGMSGQAGNISNQYNAAADRTAGMWSGVGSAAGQGMMGYAMYNKDKK